MPRKTHASKSSSGSSSGREAGTSRVATRAATGRVATGRAATGRAATGRVATQAATGRAATGRAATGRVATQAATGRAATGRAATGRAATQAATGRVATQAATGRAATGRAATGRVATQAARSQSPSTPRSQSPSTPRSQSTRAAFAAAVAAKDTNRFHNLTTDLQIAIMKMARKKEKVKLSKYDIYKKIFRNPQVFIDWLDELKIPGAVDSEKRVRNPLREGSRIYINKAKGLYPILYNLCFQVLQGNYVYDGVPRPVKIFYKKPQLKFYNKPPDSPSDKDSPPLL